MTTLIVLVSMLDRVYMRRWPLARTVTAQEARQRLGELLDDTRRGDEVIIERAGKPMGVIISPQRYADIQRQREEAKQRLAKSLAELRQESRDEEQDEVEEMILAEIHAYRREKREDAERSREVSAVSGF